MERTSRFKKLIHEAIEVKKQLDELSKPHKLSAKAFLRDAMSVADTTNEKLDELEQALKKPVFIRSSQFYRMACKYVRERTCTAPPRELRRLTWLGKADEAMAELALVQSSLFELFALAVRIVAKENPEVFGTVEDWEAYKKELSDAKTKYESLLTELEKSYGTDDLSFSDIDDEGRATVSFRISNGEIRLSPGFPERLVNWLQAHPEV